MELKGQLSRTHDLLRPAQSAGRRRIRIIMTREDIFHVGISFPAFKKKKSAPRYSDDAPTTTCSR